MRTEKKGAHIRISLQPGEYFSTKEPAVISTLLGSCVAACLYDPRNYVIGLNHFLLSHIRYSRTLPIHASEAGRYGVHAMELLINDMVSKGAQRGNLHAKVFGGASILIDREKVGNFACIGEVNCRFIREFLKNEGIPVVAEDLGGNTGESSIFPTATSRSTCEGSIPAEARSSPPVTATAGKGRSTSKR